MTNLHTNYGSGALFSAGTAQGDIGPSGINDITHRINNVSGAGGAVSGALYAVSGALTGRIDGVSGAGVATSGTLHFGGFDFPQVANMTYTSGVANEILTAAVTGENTSYVQTMTYNGEINPIIVEVSGTNIGSVVRWDFYYGAGSGTTSTGGLVAGSISIS